MSRTRAFNIIILGLALVACSRAHADAPPRPLAALDIFDLRQVADPQIAPDGKRIVYVRHFSDIMTDKRHSNLWIISADGSDDRPLTTGNRNDSSPRWSPDGKYLLMSTNRHADHDQEPRNTEVYEFAVADATVRALTNRHGPDGEPAVSPDGKHIAYVGYDDRYQGYQVSKLYVMNRDGSGPRLISGALDRDVLKPRWAADGSGIYFLAVNNGNTGLYFITLDGNLRKLASNIGSGTSAYGAGVAFSVAPGGAFAVTTTRPDLPGDIAVGHITTEGTKVITAVNRGLLSARSLGQVEMFTFKTPKDRRKIQGWIVKPPDFDPAKKYPMILEIHGGPFANYGDRFDLQMQLMAARGYVVVYINPRGSTSYGEEFGNLIHHAYPGDDLHDLVAGVDAVVAKGYIDPDQLFITGGSGGGVLTCWVIGHTNRFRAAVTVYPVTNWYSFMLTADIGGWIHKYWFPGLPWDHLEHYEKRSPLALVKNVKTPTMVLTGEDDYRTPMSDSEQYYQALKLVGADTVLVRVPDEPHGIAVRPSHQLSRILHVIGWFDRHRKGVNRK
jgi:acylaminoacyl-peptidase